MSDSYDVEYIIKNLFNGTSSSKQTAFVSNANSKLEALAKFKQQSPAHCSNKQHKIDVTNIRKRP